MFIDQIRAKPTPFRQPHGNMLAMVVLAAIGIIVVCVVGLAVSMLLLSQKRSQNQTEELSLRWSTDLNKENWIGNMNNMTGFSREMVYTSRQDLDNIIQKHARLKPLAMQLLDESRKASLIVNEERKALIVEELKGLRRTVQALEKSTTVTKSPLSTPWLNTDKPAITRVEAGFIDGVSSNVFLSDGIPELKDHDLQAKYAKEKSNVFNANINAKLPSPDDDLDFKFSSLPAAAKGTISPARLTSNNVFRKLFTVRPETERDLSKCDQLPSALQVESAVAISSPTGGEVTKGSMKITVSAAAPGATQSLP